MNVNKRNEIFEEKKHFVDITISKHIVIVRSCHLEIEDLKQELYVRLLNLIGNYDIDKCPNFDAFLMINLKYKLWNLATGSKRFGMPGAPCRGLQITSLETMEDYGSELEDYATSNTYSSLWLEEAIDSLPKKEKMTLNDFLEGKRRIHCNNALLQSARIFLIKNNDELNGITA